MPGEHPLRHWAIAGACCANLLLVACGGGGEEVTSVSPAEAPPPTASTLVDDDGGVLPSDPGTALAQDAATPRLTRYATVAQARELERALGAEVHFVEVNCCGDAAVSQAISEALASATGAQHAVFVGGSNAGMGAKVVESLLRAGLERVWWVSR